MIRFAVLALCAAACGRSQGVADRDLPGLVVEARKAEAPIDVELATKDPAELGRALAQPYRATLAALGPHRIAVNSATTVEEAGKSVSDLADHAQIDNGDDGTYRAIYTNSADYGRETTFVDGKLYLRPRYQRWHARGPEAPDEPAALRDQYVDAIAATWDLLAPGAELTDRGPTAVAGRAGRKISVGRAPQPSQPPSELVTQRKWREARSIDAVSGEVVLDRDKGVPLSVTLTGSIGFSRDGRRFAMKVSVDSMISGPGSATMIAVPADGDVVATPERLREVDDRDYLLQGIAPALRKNPDGTAVPPAPLGRPSGTPSGTPSPRPSPRPDDTRRPDAPATHRKPRSDDPPKRRAQPAQRPDDGATP